MTTGTTDQTSQENGDNRYISKRGTEFEVKVRPNGLFYIAMLRGGKTPPICDELFTSRRFAEETLTRYLKNHDPLNLVKLPEKNRVGKSKNQ